MSVRRLPQALAAAFLLVVLALIGRPAAMAGEGPLYPLSIATEAGERRFQVELARSGPERSRGLMFRRSLPADGGMLFDFGGEQVVTMWMKNTYVPLDMVFIGADLRVKTVAANTTPLSERTVSSQAPVRYVLEINAGRAAELGIRPGAIVSGEALDRLR